MTLSNNHTFKGELLGTSNTPWGHLTVKAQFSENNTIKQLRVLITPARRADLCKESDIFGAMWIYKTLRTAMLKTLEYGFRGGPARPKNEQVEFISNKVITRPSNACQEPEPNTDRSASYQIRNNNSNYLQPIRFSAGQSPHLETSGTQKEANRRNYRQDP